MCEDELAPTCQCLCSNGCPHRGLQPWPHCCRCPMRPAAFRLCVFSDELAPLWFFSFTCSVLPLQKELAQGNAIRRDMLSSNDVFIYDIGYQVFVWVGKGASINERKQVCFLCVCYRAADSCPENRFLISIFFLTSPPVPLSLPLSFSFLPTTGPAICDPVPEERGPPAGSANCQADGRRRERGI